MRKTERDELENEKKKKIPLLYSELFTKDQLLAEKFTFTAKDALSHELLRINVIPAISNQNPPPTLTIHLNNSQLPYLCKFEGNCHNRKDIILCVHFLF